MFEVDQRIDRHVPTYAACPFFYRKRPYNERIELVVSVHYSSKGFMLGFFYIRVSCMIQGDLTFYVHYFETPRAKSF